MVGERPSQGIREGFHEEINFELRSKGYDLLLESFQAMGITRSVALVVKRT